MGDAAQCMPTLLTSESRWQEWEEAKDYRQQTEERSLVVKTLVYLMGFRFFCFPQEQTPSEILGKVFKPNVLNVDFDFWMTLFFHGSFQVCAE